MKPKMRVSHSNSLYRTLFGLSIFMLTNAMVVQAAKTPTPVYSGNESTLTKLDHSNMPDMELMLEIVINGRHSDHVVPVSFRSGHYYINSALFNALDLPIKLDQEPVIALDTVPGLEISYESSLQQLLINVPMHWLPMQHISKSQQTNPLEPADNTLGLLFNYNIYASKAESSNSSHVSAYTEQRLFGGFGFISNNGVYQHRFKSSQSKLDNFDFDSKQKNRYLRYDTHWHYNDENRMLQYAIGDAITDALTWSSSVRLGGLRIGRNFATNPDLITYPLPQFAGQAAVPSAVDLYVNNLKHSTSEVEPGPFTIETIPYINGAGDATVVVTDLLGRRVSTEIPFYVSSDLLRAGLSDFSLSIGAIRKNYGIKSFDYGDLAASGVGRYGLTNWLTLEAHIEGANKLAVAGLGSNMILGQFGVLSTSYSNSSAQGKIFRAADKDHHFFTTPLLEPAHFIDQDSIFQEGHKSGKQTLIGYSFSNYLFNISAQRLIRSKHYGDLSMYKSGFQLQRRIDRISGGFSLNKVGSFGAGFFDIRHADGNKTRFANLSFSRALWKNSSIHMSANREIGGNGYSAQITITLPLERNQMISLSSNKDENNHWNNQVNYSRTAPTDGGLGWNFAYADGESTYKQANLDWVARNFRLQGGSYGNKHQNYWSELSGSLIAMDKSLYAARQINDAFVLVSTDGYANIPVRYENQLIGVTDKNGYLLIPTVSSYARSLYEIDPLNLPENIKTTQIRQRHTAREKRGLLVKFPVRTIRAANFTLLDETGKELPRGSIVYLEGSDAVSYTGWDSLVYLEGVDRENHLTVERSDNKQTCSAQLTLSNLDTIQTLPKPIICKDNHDEPKHSETNK